MYRAPPDLHYVWIGPPKEDGHDIKAVLDMAAWNLTLPAEKQHKIFFWCLERYILHYRSKFSQVQVCSCESLLFSQDEAEEPRESVSISLLLKSRSAVVFQGLVATETIRGYVSAKVIFAFLLLYFKGGYYLDTNISPTEETSFIRYERFKTVKSLGDNCIAQMVAVPLDDACTHSGVRLFTPDELRFLLLQEKCRVTHVWENYDEEVNGRYGQDTVNARLADVYLMYCPRYNVCALRILMFYHMLWPGAVARAAVFTTAPRYQHFKNISYLRIGSLPLESILAAIHFDISYQDPARVVQFEERENEHFFSDITVIRRRSECGVKAIVSINELKVRKCFNSTHQYGKASPDDRQKFFSYLSTYHVALC